MRKLAKESGERVYWDEQVCEAATLEDIGGEKVKWFLKEARFYNKQRISKYQQYNEVYSYERPWWHCKSGDF